MHAHGAGESIFHHLNTKAVGDSDLKVPGAKNGVVPIDLRRDRGDERASVGLGDTVQTLGFALVGRVVNQVTMHLFVKGEGGLAGRGDPKR